MSILQTKLIVPPLHPDLVSRSRLTDKISSGIKLGNKLTLVAAPAGFGKSTTVSIWANERQCKVSWFSLDDQDNEPIQFWAHLVASVQTVYPQFGQEIFAALTATPPAPVNSILPGLVNEFANLETMLGLVLDDYHVIHNQEIHDSISYLLEHQPQQVHILLSTRVDPSLSIARLRAQRLLTEIRANDLRFTLEETQQLLNGVIGLNLSPAEIALMENRTEGWGVGLLLAAQSMQGRSDKGKFISEFSGTQQYILEYLVEEVLNRQTDYSRKFLLQTSILDRFCVPLCNHVTEDKNSEEIINQLKKNNLFIIPLDQNQSWYRYHHLFADLLKNILQKEILRTEYLELHRRASQWYRGEGDIDQSINYAFSGEDYQTAADLIDQIVDQVISQGRVKTLLQWMALIPEEIIQSRPRLLMHQGWTTFLSGQVTQAFSILHKAKDNLNTIEKNSQRDLLNGQLSALIATMTALTRDINGAISLAKEAITLLPEKELIYRARAIRALGVCFAVQGNLEEALEQLSLAKDLAIKAKNNFLASEILSQIATLRKHQGTYSLAAETYQQILDLYRNPEQSPPACLGYIGLAQISLERNDLEEAEILLTRGIELSQKGNIGYALQAAYLLGGLLKCAQGDIQAALETIQKGDSLFRMGGGSLEGILGLVWIQTRINLICGNLEKAEGWALGNYLHPGWSFDNMPTVLDEMHQSLLALIHLKNGDYEEVLKISDRVCVQAENGGRLSRVAELNLFKAVALKNLGQQDTALQAFEKSLSLAAPEGIIRLFLEAGTAVIDLIEILKPEEKGNKFIKKLLVAFGGHIYQTGEHTDFTKPQDALVEPLTRREQEILRLICDGFSNQQIADALIVSVNTVKKHTSNIYSKLGVRNRAQAVIRARDYGLI